MSALLELKASPEFWQRIEHLARLGAEQLTPTSASRIFAEADITDLNRAITTLRPVGQHVQQTDSLYRQVQTLTSLVERIIGILERRESSARRNPSSAQKRQKS